MSKEKQIDEMAKVICNSYAEKKYCETCPTPWCYAEECATLLFCAGYRKQIEGRWTPRHKDTKAFCPNCGAKMRKEDEGK